MAPGGSSSDSFRQAQRSAVQRRRRRTVGELGSSPSTRAMLCGRSAPGQGTDGPELAGVLFDPAVANACSGAVWRDAGAISSAACSRRGNLVLQVEAPRESRSSAVPCAQAWPPLFM